MLQRVSIFLFCLIQSVVSFSQSPDLGWAGSLTGPNIEAIGAMTSDGHGNILLAGTFQESIDVAPSSAEFLLSGDAGSKDAFLVKLNASGSVMWAVTFGGTGFEQILDLTVCDAGNIIVTGNFSGTCDFNPGTSVHNLTSNGDQDVFILKLNPDGSFGWAVSIGGSSADIGKCLAIDGHGNTIIGGYFSGTVDFDPGVGADSKSSAGMDDGFIMKVDGQGNYLWSQVVGGTESDNYADVAIDAQNNIYAAGSYIGTVDLDPGVAEEEYTAEGNQDIFLQQFNENGSLLEIKSYGSAGGDFCKGLAFDNQQRLVMLGKFLGTIDLDSGPGTAYLSSSESGNAFLQKLDGNLELDWARSFGGTGYIMPEDLSIDASGNIYSIGGFTKTVDFDPTAGSYELTSNGDEDYYLQKLDASGDFEWVLTTGGTGLDRPHGMYVGSHGIYLAGDFQNTVDLDPGSASQNITADGLFDVSLQYFEHCALDVSVRQEGNVLTANVAGATYRWLDCSSNAPVSGAISQSFAPEVSGSYALEITDGSCTDTSACYQVSTSNLEASKAEDVGFYPNPANNTLHFTNKSKEAIEISIMDLQGKLYLKQSIEGAACDVDISMLKDGLYMVQLQDKAGVRLEKLVVR